MPAPLKLVYSFAPEDDAFYRQLASHLHPLMQRKLLFAWDKDLIAPGISVEQERRNAWRSADMILLLLSANYFSSPDYDSEEMQQALERQRSGQVLIVPILVRPCAWQASVVGHLHCLPRNEVPVTSWDNQDEAFLSIVEGLRQFIAARESSGAPLSLEQRANRQGLLRRVRAIWIEGFLEPSLQHATWIDLHLQRRTDALERAWSLMVQELDRRPRNLPPGTSILQVFEEADEELFILGDPGSGKTTLLLYLARTLLDRADRDENRRIPVVFNLSSWSQRRLPLDQWLVEELKVRYLVPQPMGRAWIEANQIFPLLDGLDEVAEPARVACVQAITDYTQRSLDPTPMVLCCRTQEYQALPKLPPIHYAILLLPFTEEQMESYLSSVSGPIDALRQVLREDRELFELARQPLMLSIFAQAYEGDASTDLSMTASASISASIAEPDYPHALFKHYIQNMLHRRARLRTVTEEQMYRWLTYFATQLYRQQQTIFAVEELQPPWLPERLRALYRQSMPLVYALTFGLIFGPFFGLAFGLIYAIILGSISRLSFGLAFGLVVGVGGGLIGGLVFGLTFKQHETIQPAEITAWSWASARQGMRVWSLGGLIVGVASALIGGFLSGLNGGVVVGLASFLVITLVGVLVGGLPPRQLPEKENFLPNEGIWRSGRRGFLLVLLAILLFGLAGGAIVALFGQAIHDVQSGLTLGLVLGAAGGLCFGLTFGLVGGRTGFAAFLQHFTLRFFLWRYKLLPWDLVAFLNEAAERLLLRKVGGSYIFVHRLLRDVLAAQEE